MGETPAVSRPVQKAHDSDRGHDAARRGHRHHSAAFFRLRGGPLHRAGHHGGYRALYPALRSACRPDDAFHDPHGDFRPEGGDVSRQRFEAPSVRASANARFFLLQHDAGRPHHGARHERHQQDWHRARLEPRGHLLERRVRDRLRLRHARLQLEARADFDRNHPGHRGVHGHFPEEDPRRQPPRARDQRRGNPPLQRGYFRRKDLENARDRG